MNFSRGTGLVELYLKTFELSESDWDVLAEGMKWVHRVFPAFKQAPRHNPSAIAGDGDRMSRQRIRSRSPTSADRPSRQASILRSKPQESSVPSGR